MAQERGWTASDVPDQSGRVCIVTGANTGLGFEASRVLARRGAGVILACRNLEKGRAALDRIRRESPAASVDVAELDLASLASIRRFAAMIGSSRDRVDVLVNNAGVMAIPETKTADGFEMQIGVNHLGHFALTRDLWSLIAATPGARVVTVSSEVHRRGQVKPDDLFFARRPYGAWAAYAQSKLANLLFAFELDRRLRRASRGTPSGPGGEAAVTSLAAHPGYAATELQARGPQQRGSAVGLVAMRVANAVFAQSAAAGAWPELRAATDPTAQGGDFFGPRVLNMWGAAVHATPSAAARDEATAAELWSRSEALTGGAFTVDGS